MGTLTTPAQQNPDILVKEIKDQYIRKNFLNIADYFAAQNQLLNFKFYELQVKGAQSNQTLSHGLGVLPKDIIVSFVSGPGQITFDVSKSDIKNLSYSTTDDVYCRFFVGSYWGNKSTNGDPGKMIVGQSQFDSLFSSGISGMSLISSGGIVPPVWGYPGLRVLRKTSKYSASINDYILASGASFTITLPTAVGAVGQIVIQHNGDNLSQVYALNTTDGQNIGGIPNGGYKLFTTGETLVLVPDGANWQILDHKAQTPWISFNMPTHGSTTNPTPASGAISLASWRRDGQNSYIAFYFQQGTGGNGGSGVYSWIPPFTYDLSAFPSGVATAGMQIGTFKSSGNGTDHGSPNGTGFIYATSPTNIKAQYILISVETTQDVDSSHYGMGGAVIYEFNTFGIPVVGWQP